MQRIEESERAIHRHSRDFRDRVLLNEDIARGAVQPAAVAVGAGLDAEVLGQFLADHAGFCLSVTPFEVRNDALEAMASGHCRAAPGQIFELDLLVAASIQQHVADRLVELRIRSLDVEVKVTGQALNELKVIRIAAIPASHRATGQTQLRVPDHAGGIEKLANAQAITGFTGAGRVVEGKQSWLQLHDAVVTYRAGEPVGEQDPRVRPVSHRRDLGGSIGELERRLEGLGQPLGNVGPDLEPIDHDLDRMFPPKIQLRRIIQLVGFAVDPGSYETLGAQLGK